MKPWLAHPADDAHRQDAVPRMRAGFALRAAAACLLLAFLAGCASITRLPAPPSQQVTAIDVLGVPDSRFWADGDPAPIIAYYERVLSRRNAGRPIGRGGRIPPAHFLALSGGADDGAFGAGVLVGWTETGQRPEFELVTGISAGALIAPFAFLGPSYDPQLRALFTEIAPSDVVQLGRLALSVLFREALADTAPLARLIERHADAAMLQAIAAEHQRGRLLLIGTVNLDVGRPVIWNIGAIAASGHPEALNLFRSILLASASIPGAFPPVMIDVEANGRAFQEMHVDGGAFTQVFLYPRSVTRERRANLRHGDHVQPVRAYIIRNGRLTPNPARTERQTFVIAQRAIASMISASGFNDVARIRNTTREDKVDFNLAVIGPDFQDEPKEPFEQAFMRKLYDHAFAQARVGYPWMKDLPY